MAAAVELPSFRGGDSSRVVGRAWRVNVFDTALLGTS